jgi:hypothetical protein
MFLRKSVDLLENMADSFLRGAKKCKNVQKMSKKGSGDVCAERSEERALPKNSWVYPGGIQRFGCSCMTELELRRFVCGLCAVAVEKERRTWVM